jgi:hypothetical protein
MVSATVNPVNGIHAFPRERENIFYVHRTETGIAWRFAFRENKNKTLDIRRLVRRLRLPASLLFFFFFFSSSPSSPSSSLSL